MQAQIAQRLETHRLEEQRKQTEADQKEKLRVTVRQRLAMQLGKAKSLHAVLRAFAIPVEGGLVPTQAQLQKAYRRATILFHPDKHVNAGLEKQLAAEEAFKIISHAAHKQSSK